MNRFYKPTPREYVSTHVDMPWEFLQGVAEQKQKGFDTAIATGDAANSLLNFEVIPGDTAAKKEIQKKYNDRILEAQDFVQQTGDFSTASRKLAGVVRDIAQDPYINNMKAAVPIWKEQQKEKDKLESEGEILDFNNKWNYMHSTVDPTTGMTRSYNQQLPYKGRTIGKAVYDDFKDAIDGKVIQTWGDRVEKKNGEWVYRETDKRLGKDLLPIMQTAGYEISGRYPNYFRDRTAHEIKNGISKEEETPKWLQSLMGGLASEYHVDNVKKTYDTDWQYEYLWKKQQDKLAEQPLVLPVDDTSMEMKGKTFDLGRTLKSNAVLGGSTTGAPSTFNEKPTVLKPAEVFNKEEYSQYKEFMNKTNPQLHLKMFQGKASDEEIQGTYQKFKEYYDAVHLGISSNTKVRMINGTPELHELLTSEKKADINLYELEHGGGIGSAAPVLNVTTGEWTTFGELSEKFTGEKSPKVKINKEILPYNGIVLNAKENGIAEPDRFSTGYGFTMDKTQDQYIFAKPKEHLSQDEKNINKIHTNTWIPGEPEELVVPTSDGSSKKAYVVFDPNMPLNEYTARRQRGEPVGGVILAYKTKAAADRKSTNPDDMLFEPTADVNDPIYMYQSDPATVYNNIKRVFKYEADDAADKAAKEEAAKKATKK